MAKGGSGGKGGSAPASTGGRNSGSSAASAGGNRVATAVSNPSSQRREYQTTVSPSTPTNVTYNLNESVASTLPTAPVTSNTPPATPTPSRQDVKGATQTIRQQIRSITPRTGAIADIDAYNQALAVLTGAGKTKQVTKFTTRAEKEIKSDTRRGRTRGLLPKPGETPKPGEGGTPGPGDQNNIYDITKDPAYQSLLGELAQSKTDKEGLEGQLSTLGGELADFKSQLETLRANKAEQTGGDYQPTDVSTSTTTEEFEPFSRDLFTSLLGELESSKKRQKDWDYEQALKAYKF